MSKKQEKNKNVEILFALKSLHNVAARADDIKILRRETVSLLEQIDKNLDKAIRKINELIIYMKSLIPPEHKVHPDYKEDILTNLGELNQNLGILKKIIPPLKKVKGTVDSYLVSLLYGYIFKWILTAEINGKNKEARDATKSEEWAKAMELSNLFLRENRNNRGKK